MATKRNQADKDAPRPPENTTAASVGEEVAVSEAMAERVTSTRRGPVLHVPTTADEATEVGNQESLAVARATGRDADRDAERPVTGDRYHRIVAWDGPLNVNERNAFDPLKPDLVSTNPAALGPATKE